MKLATVFLLWIAVFAYGQAAPASSNHDERAIRQLNVDVLKAYNLGDVKTLDRVEDVDFTLTGDFGEVTKAQQIDDVSYRKPNARSVNVIDQCLGAARRGLEASSSALFQAEQVVLGWVFRKPPS
jgi:hypothetical protein